MKRERAAAKLEGRESNDDAGSTEDQNSDSFTDDHDTGEVPAILGLQVEAGEILPVSSDIRTVITEQEDGLLVTTQRLLPGAKDKGRQTSPSACSYKPYSEWTKDGPPGDRKWIDIALETINSETHAPTSCNTSTSTEPSRTLETREPELRSKESETSGDTSSASIEPLRTMETREPELGSKDSETSGDTSGASTEPSGAMETREPELGSKDSETSGASKELLRTLEQRKPELRREDSEASGDTASASTEPSQSMEQREPELGSDNSETDGAKTQLYYNKHNKVFKVLKVFTSGSSKEVLKTIERREPDLGSEDSGISVGVSDNKTSYRAKRGRPRRELRPVSEDNEASESVCRKKTANQEREDRLLRITKKRETLIDLQIEEMEIRIEEAKTVRDIRIEEAKILREVAKRKLAKLSKD